MVNSQLAEITLSYTPAIGTKPIVKSSLDAFSAVKKFFITEILSLQEQVSVLYLNNAGRVIGGYRLASGGLTNTIVDIRLVLAVALKSAAVSFIIAHNHPSGNLTPSTCDRALTNRLKEAAELMQLRLHDHIIVSPDDTYFSFSDEGML